MAIWGIFLAAPGSAVTNAGAISGSAGWGVYLKAGGMVNNQSTGTIIGSAGVGVAIGGVPGVVANGSVTNAGTISGTATDGAGIRTLDGWAAVTNTGAIIGTGTYSVGIGLGGGSGSTVNNQGGSITGGVTGIYSTGAAPTATNAGTISGGSIGVSMTAGGTVMNQGGATISGGNGVAIIGGFDGVYITGGAGSVTNYGNISDAAPKGFGVRLLAGGAVNNHAGASIGSQNIGVYIGGGAGSVTNAGTITGSGNDGVSLNAGRNGYQPERRYDQRRTRRRAAFWRRLLDQLRDHRRQQCDGNPIRGRGCKRRRKCDQHWDHFRDGRNELAGVTLSNGSSLTNSGNISVTGNNVSGVYMYNNAGSVTNLAGGTITSTDSGIYVGNGHATVTNAGTIAGTGVARARALSFTAAAQ